VTTQDTLAAPSGDAADTSRYGSAGGNRPARATLPQTAAFWILSGLFLMLFFASASTSRAVMPPEPCTGPPCVHAFESSGSH
jgi:hypothetical protein